MTFFAALARQVLRFRLLVIAGWAVIIVAAVVALPSLGSEVNRDPSLFLPASAPSVQATSLGSLLLGNKTTSKITIIAASSGQLTQPDEAAIRREARLAHPDQRRQGGEVRLGLPVEQRRPARGRRGEERLGRARAEARCGRPAGDVTVLLPAVRYNGACGGAGEDNVEGRRRMFFVTYLRRELSRRLRRAIFVALGLAIGVGLAVTVSAASAGVAGADPARHRLRRPDHPGTGGGQRPVHPAGPARPGGLHRLRHQVRERGRDDVASTYSGMTASMVAETARLRGVAAAAGGIMLLDQTSTVTKDDVLQSGGYTVYGVDTSAVSLGPLSSASLVSGHSFTATESDSDIAVVDSGYATSHSLKVGSSVTIDQVRYTVIGIVSQPQGSSPPDVYVPLARAQAPGRPGDRVAGQRREAGR